MFTGLVLGLGRIREARRVAGEIRFRILPECDLPDILLGESIAVNGVCLTVESTDQTVFDVYASDETVSTTNLGSLRVNDRVNLERALALGERLGGHLVSGHVDCLARVETVAPVGESRRISLSFPQEFGALVVPKGSVALDGISLTVNTCAASLLEVNIIPATWKHTTIAGWTPGSAVNMETDLIGKYVQRMLAPWRDDASSPSGAITERFLREHGF